LRSSGNEEFKLRPAKTSIGRGGGNDIVLAHYSVSRYHALIEMVDGRYEVADLGSLNGSYVNEERIERAPLADGDLVRFGSLQFSFTDRATPQRDLTTENLLDELLAEARSLGQSGTVDGGLNGALAALEEKIERTLRRNAKLVDRNTRKLATLYEASKVLNFIFDQEQLLERMIELAVSVMRGDSGFVMLYDQAGELRQVAGRGLEATGEAALVYSKSVAREAASTGRPILTGDALSDERFKMEQSVIDLGIRSVVCVPVKDKEQKVLGVIYVGDQKRTRSFAPEDVELLEAFANHAAIAIENARLYQGIRRSERLSAVGQMAAALIHDLKSPMTSVRGYAELVAESSSDPRVQRYAGAIMQEIDRFVAMTQEILAYARGESEPLRAERIGLAEFLDQCLERQREALAREGIGVVVDLDWDGELWGDRARLQRVVDNVIRNAREALESGGQLQIRAARLTPALVRLSFADNGRGMPVEIARTVFEPFVTYGKERGTGLGLAIVKKIVEEHRGAVEIQSTVGQGTTVLIDLPRAAEPEESTAG
jgi:signal transduction histidine kinase/pSer/pThr/pTyr-binding forkhead associated (FHA) protein